MGYSSSLMDYPITPLAVLGTYKNTYPYASLYKDNLGPEDLSPAFLSALCVAFFDSAISLIPECEQNSFEECFKDSFLQLLKERHHFSCSPEKP